MSLNPSGLHGLNERDIAGRVINGYPRAGDHDSRALHTNLSAAHALYKSAATLAHVHAQVVGMAHGEHIVGQSFAWYTCELGVTTR